MSEVIVVGSAPLASLRWIETTPERWDWRINEEFRLYYGRLIPRDNRANLDDWLASHAGDAFVMVRPNAQAAEFLSARGLHRADRVMVDVHDEHELWHRPGAAR
jgi:hypothetical protein